MAKEETARDRRLKASGRTDATHASTAGHDTSPPLSEVADHLLAFADNLRANVKEALKFSEEEVAKRLGWDATKKAETHFVTRAKKTSKELHQRRKDFDDIDADCGSEDRCRPLVDDLVGGGLPRNIVIVADDLADIAARAQRPLSDNDRDLLRGELQGLRGFCNSLMEVATWIEDEVRASRGQTVPGRISTSDVQAEPALPPEIATVIQEAEKDASVFIDIVTESMTTLEPRESKSTLAWLKGLDRDISRLEAASKKVVQRLKRFTNKDREDAEQQGRARFLQFLDNRERILQRVAARRAVSTGLVKGVIERLRSRLSLSDRGADAADRIGARLDDLSRRLQSDQRRLERQADSATNERLANAVTAKELPAWKVIHGQDDGGGSTSDLAMLLMAFVDYSGKAPEFKPGTKKQLRERLDRLFRAERGRRFSESWVDRCLDKAIKLKIVYKHDQPVRRKRTDPDEFELCRAAIRKYRGHLIRPQSGREASGR